MTGLLRVSLPANQGGTVGEMRHLLFEELDPQLQGVLQAKRLGYLGEFVSVGGHQGKATTGFQALTEVLEEALPSELSEVASSVASRRRNAYEQTQHERLAATLELSVDWIAVGGAECAALSEEARVASRMALAVVDGYGHGAGDELTRAVDVLGDDKAAGAPFALGRYVADAVVSNTLALEAPVKGTVAVPPEESVR
jgi:hypothetical protein